MSGRETTKRRNSFSSSSSSSESSDTVEKGSSRQVKSTRKVKDDATEKHVPQVAKMYDEFDVPSRDYDPSPVKKTSDSECRRKMTGSKDRRDRKKACRREKHDGSRVGMNEKSHRQTDKVVSKKNQKAKIKENTEDENSDDKRSSISERKRYRDKGSRGNREKENDNEMGQERRRKRNKDEMKYYAGDENDTTKKKYVDKGNANGNNDKDRGVKSVGVSVLRKGSGHRRDKSEERVSEKYETVDKNVEIESENSSKTIDRMTGKNEKIDLSSGNEQENEKKKNSADGRDGHDGRAKGSEKRDRNEEKENDRGRRDRNGRSKRELRTYRDIRDEGKREIDKSANPRKDSDNRRNRRRDDRFSWSRGDYSYDDNNPSTMRRYWDNESNENVRRKRRHESEERVLVGERFYGEDCRKKAEKANNRRSMDRENTKVSSEKLEKDITEITQAQKRTVDLLTSKTGGAYIPPAKLRMMQAEITDKSGAAYQRIAWEALKKSIHGHINKINTSNIGLITRELLRENIVRGRGLLARSIIQAQAASPTFTSVYAALTAVVNSKFPNIGELLLRRLVIQFKRGFRRNNKQLCISSGTFIAHLVNQRVAHEILALEFLTLLVETPTDDSIEVAIAFLKECGMKLTEVSRKGIEAIFEMLRNILHEGQLDKRVQYMIEVMFQIRKDGFKDHEAVNAELDLVDEENQYTHLITLDEAMDSQDILNVFKFDPDYIANEEKYKQLSKEILDTDGSGSESEGDEDEDDDGGGDNDGGDDDDDDDDDDDENDQDAEAEGSGAEATTKQGIIVDNTETNLTALRRTIYLTIHSSLDFEECAHKLMKMQLKPGQEIELCHMFLDCCAEMRTYEKFFGLLAGRFCAINRMYVTPFEQIFKDSYDTIHRLDTNKLRNVSKFFAHLLFTDSISWGVLNCIRLNEEDTTSSSRIFIKILFQELSEYMGLSKLNQRVKDVTLQEAFDGLFPRDDPKNTRFAINFFTSIGLGGLTDDLREHLKNRPKPVPPVPPINKQTAETSSASSSSSSSSESSESSSASSSASSSSSSSTSSSSSSNSDSSSDSSDSSSSEEQRKKAKNKNKKKRMCSSLSDNGNAEKKKSANEKGLSDKRNENSRSRKERKNRKESKHSTSSKTKNSKKKARF